MSDTLTMAGTDIARSILSGEYDSDLDVLAEAVRMRRKDVKAREGRMNALTLKPGDHVRMHGLTPKILNDAVVEVVSLRRTRVNVKAIDGVTNPLAAQRVGTHGTCGVPLTCVTKVDADA